MPAGLPYFAWIDVGETTFTAGHMRWDEDIFSFTLKQEEGDPASLTIVVRRPRNVSGDPIGLLGPGRKIWAWFALDCGPALVKFRGRLVGVPTSLFEDLVTLEFVARPVDVVAQKAALAETLKVLPFYDEAVIDPARASDPDVVLEGYTAIWAFNPETHVITVSDEISGEDGLVEFHCSAGDILYDGLALNLTTGPLARVDLSAEYTWTQRARGTVDLTSYLVKGWPGQINGAIQLNAGDWPKHGTGLGDGWEVADSSAADLHNYTVRTQNNTAEFTVKFGEGDVSKATITESVSFIGGRPPAVPFTTADKSWVITNESYSSTFGADGAPGSISHNLSASKSTIAIQEIKPTLVAGYSAERQCTERVTLTLFADVQPILTDPEDGEALRIDDIRSVNLTEIALADQVARSFIATERGNRSIEHLIVFARAHLMKRARAVEITFVPKLERMPEITLRKNAFVDEPRIGEALGKIIGYSIALDGNDGRIKCEVTIGCTIGRGGVAAAADGEPTYCAIDYTGSDYQQFINRTVLFLVDSSVGYSPPNADPNDDGINFLGGLTWRDVIQNDLVVIRGAAANEDQDPPTNTGSQFGTTQQDNVDRLLEARSEWIRNTWLPYYETRATFKLKSMTREFSTDYIIAVTDLKIPTGYNLEAV